MRRTKNITATCRNDTVKIYINITIKNISICKKNPSITGIFKNYFIFNIKLKQTIITIYLKQNY